MPTVMMRIVMGSAAVLALLAGIAALSGSRVPSAAPTTPNTATPTPALSPTQTSITTATPNSNTAPAATGPVSRATPSPIPNFPLNLSGSLPAPHTHSHTAGASAFRCPMDCEHGKIYPLAADCPVCHMKLVEFRDGKVEHGDHTSKHGGVFFMDADNWHHVEGVLTTPRDFRLYIYDNFTQPIFAGQCTATVDVTSGSGAGRTGLPMITGPNGAYLQVTLPESQARPICLAVRVVLTYGKASSLFNFTFDAK